MRRDLFTTNPPASAWIVLGALAGMWAYGSWVSHRAIQERVDSGTSAEADRRELALMAFLRWADDDDGWGPRVVVGLAAIPVVGVVAWHGPWHAALWWGIAPFLILLTVAAIVSICGAVVSEWWRRRHDVSSDDSQGAVVFGMLLLASVVAMPATAAGLWLARVDGRTLLGAAALSGYALLHSAWWVARRSSG